MNSNARFRLKLAKIASNVERESLEQLKFLCKDVIPDGDREKISTPEQLFLRLEQRSLLAANGVEFLRDCLKQVGRDDLANELSAFEDDREEGKEEVVYQMQRWDASVQAEMEQMVHEVIEKAFKINNFIKKAVNAVCKVGSANGIFSAIVGACLVFGTGMATIMTAGASSPLAMIMSMASSAYVMTDSWKNCKTISEIEEADRAAKVAVKQMIDLLKTGEQNQDRLVFLAVHVIRKFGTNHFIVAMIKESLPLDLRHKILFAGETQTALELALKAGAGGVMTVISRGARAAEDVGAKTVGDVAAKTVAKAALETDAKKPTKTTGNDGEDSGSGEVMTDISREARGVGAKMTAKTTGDTGVKMTAKTAGDVGVKMAVTFV